VFSADELVQLRGFPEIGRAELIRFFMLTPADEEFIRGFRDRKNMLGAAVQLCTLPWLGFVPDDVAAAPAAAVARLSERLGIPVGELRGYGAREQTRTGHLREVAAHLGWRQVDGPRWKDLEEFLFARALEHDSPKLLFRLACEYLSSSRLIRPGVVHILQRVATARKRARGETWQRVEPMLTGFLRGELDGLLVPDPLLGRTRLAWLGTGPVSSAPAAVKGELEKLAYLRGMDAHTLDLSVLPAERRRFLAGLGRRLTAQNLARRDDDRRYPILLTLAAQSAVDVLDEVLLMFDQALSGREAAAREKLTGVLAERARTGEDRQALLDDILAIVLDPGVTDDQVGGRLRRDVGHERMRAAHEARRERLPRDHGHLAMMDASMSYLRQFVPDVLAAVDFAGGPGMDDLLQAVGILAGLHARKARKVPDGAPDSFVPARWAGYLEKAAKKESGKNRGRRCSASVDGPAAGGRGRCRRTRRAGQIGGGGFGSPMARAGPGLNRAPALGRRRRSLPQNVPLSDRCRPAGSNHSAVGVSEPPGGRLHLSYQHVANQSGNLPDSE
jgi:hypothetical protein